MKSCSPCSASFRSQIFDFLIERQQSCLIANLCKIEVPAMEPLLHAMEWFHLEGLSVIAVLNGKPK